MSTTTEKYEVQFKDGFGSWRRWSMVSTQEAANRSHARLRTMLGNPLLPSRIVLREGK
jgi:hypothetical protein